MKRIIIILTLTIGLAMQAMAAETDYVFANIKTGQETLTADDNYFNRMSKAEIAIRSFSVTADKTTEDLKAQYGANILEWTSAEKNHITQLVMNNRARLNGIAPLLPPQVIFIKTTGLVEGGLPHTRANAIILPVTGEPLTETLFFHELFHVLSRHQKARHHSLYDLIGFKPCDFTATAEIQAKSLTNPDVPAEGYYLPVEINGKATNIMTFLHADREAFDPAIEKGFSGHFGFGLLKVTGTDGHCTVDNDANGKAQILSPDMVPGFFTAIGRNTPYIIHPEEVLADNFVFAITGKTDLPNPEIPARLRQWLGATVKK